MHAAPARYVSSSELYSADEVELLLEEIRELEPTSCRGEEVQDFEIAGSGCAGAGGRSPAGTELTERSWDSHANYSRAPPPRPRPLAPVYCRLAHLREPQGAFTLFLVVCSACACGCAWAGAGRGAAPALGARVRLLQLAALTSLMLHALLLALHVTRLAALLPLDWNKLGGCACVWSALSLCGGGALTLQGALLAPPPRAAPALLAAAALALCGAAAAACACALRVRAARVRAAHRRPHGAAYRAVPQPSPAPAALAGPAAAQDQHL